MGPQVDQYLAAAKVSPGNPWCASFITWSLQKAGHPMPGGGWAAVQTWVRNAEAGQNGLKIVSAQDARPGDIVAYDWGGQEDFGSDGHIGFLDSTVQGGKFKALEGNNADAVSSVDRQMGSANIKFIRIEGNAPAGAAQVPAPSGNGVAQVADQAPAPASGSSAPIDPTQFGGDGHGGPPGAEALALLNNKNIVFDSDGISDIKAGRIDPRVVAVLTKLSGEHKITVTCMCSDHDKFTAGGSVSNHHFGRGMDIGAIDGETVGPGSPLAREVASELSGLNSDYRPNEIGSPFAIAGPGYFTDAAHQNHIHVGFKQEIPADWKPPSDVAAAAPAPAAAGAPVATAAAVAPGTPPAAAAAAAAPPPGVKKSSQMFLRAVTAKDSAADAKQAASNESLGFLKAVEPPKADAAAVPTPAAAPAAAPVDPAAAGAPAAQASALDPAAAAAVAAAAPDAYPGDSAPARADRRLDGRSGAEARAAAAAAADGLARRVGHDEHPRRRRGFRRLLPDARRDLEPGRLRRLPREARNCRSSGSSTRPRRSSASGSSRASRSPIRTSSATGSPTSSAPPSSTAAATRLKLGEANSLLGSAPAQPAAAPVAAAAAAVPVDPGAAAASAAALGDAKLPAEVLAPVEQAIAAGNAPGPKALAAIEEASKYVGTDYKWGGSTPQTGFDCSGLMQWAYAQSGVQIPRVTYTQIAAANGVEIADKAALKPGDLVFFANAGDVHHVGMYLGGDKFLHAPHTGDVVKVSSLDEPYYASQFAGGRRFDQGAGVAAVPSGAPAAAAAAPAVASAASVDPAAAAAAAPAAPAASAIDPTEVAKAQAAVARDAAEVRRNESQLFQAVKAVEAHQGTREARLDDVPEGGRPVAGQAPAADRPLQRPPAPPAEAPAPAPVPDPAAAAPAPARRSGAGRRRTRRRDARSAAAPGDGVAAASIDLTNTATDYPGDNASQAELAKWLAKQADAGRPPARASGHGLAGGVRRQEPQLRRRRLRRLLPDARRDLEPGRLRRLPGEARAAGQVVHRPGARGQAQGDRRRRRQLRQGPLQVRRVDRQRRTPRRAIPRPLPAAARRGAQAVVVLEGLKVNCAGEGGGESEPRPSLASPVNRALSACPPGAPRRDTDEYGRGLESAISCAPISRNLIETGPRAVKRARQPWRPGQGRGGTHFPAHARNCRYPSARFRANRAELHGRLTAARDGWLATPPPPPGAVDFRP